ncbi:MAG: hypothetical protein HXY34_13395 [Candidatus Thorarchaeota archaeon]|nr:hypothetical protein [Candidatus Thorarchaeota archaeon]
MSIDLCIMPAHTEDLTKYIDMARALGLCGLAMPGISCQDEAEVNGVTVYSRRSLNGKSARAIKDQVARHCSKYTIISMPLCSASPVVWASPDSRVDMISVTGTEPDCTLCKTVARHAASSGTVLEVSLSPLISQSGLERSRTIKTLRESVRTAVASDMQVVLSSYATTPLEMRSPSAMVYAGRLLGLDESYLKHAVREVSGKVVARARMRRSQKVVYPGVEIMEA